MHPYGELHSSVACCTPLWRFALLFVVQHFFLVRCTPFWCVALLCDVLHTPSARYKSSLRAFCTPRFEPATFALHIGSYAADEINWSHPPTLLSIKLDSPKITKVTKFRFKKSYQNYKDAYFTSSWCAALLSHVLHLCCKPLLHVALLSCVHTSLVRCTPLWRDAHLSGVSNTSQVRCTPLWFVAFLPAKVTIVKKQSRCTPLWGTALLPCVLHPFLANCTPLLRVALLSGVLHSSLSCCTSL